MRRLFLSVLLLPVLLGSALAAEPGVPAADRQAIQGVITRQIEAFRHDDGPGAFAYAAPNIQAMFGTPERFLGMVRQGYQPVYRPRSVQFSELREEDGQVVQAVELVGPDGVPQTALYSMERGADGQWRIAGCVLVRSGRLTT